MAKRLLICAVLVLSCFKLEAAPRCNTCERTTSGRIRRNSSARRGFRMANPCPATNSVSGACPGYVIDHIVPLKRGGLDRPDNMQWQTRAAAREKDRTE
jgi:hypothetical protein